MKPINKTRQQFSSYTVRQELIQCQTEGCKNTFVFDNWNHPRKWCDKCRMRHKADRALKAYYRKQKLKKLSWIPVQLRSKLRDIEE